MPGAAPSENQKGRRMLGKAFEDIGAVGLLADGMQFAVANPTAGLLIFRTEGKSTLQPVGFFGSDFHFELSLFRLLHSDQSPQSLCLPSTVIPAKAGMTT